MLANNPTPGVPAAPNPLEAALTGAVASGVIEVVTDANLAADLLIGTPARRARARRFFALCARLNIALVAPILFGVELDSALRRAVMRRQVPAGHLPALHQDADRLPVSLVTDAAALDAARQRARVIAGELAQPANYDALYAAIAEARGCPFWTADKRFANAAQQVKRQPDGTTALALPIVRYLPDFDPPPAPQPTQATPTKPSTR